MVVLFRYLKEVILERADMSSKSRFEQEQLMHQVVSIEMEEKRVTARADVDRHAPARVRKTGVCSAAWAWYHGLTV